jgi:hypothetical protein
VLEEQLLKTLAKCPDRRLVRRKSKSLAAQIAG